MVRLHVDAEHMGAYEVFVLSWRQTLEAFADSLADERFNLGRRHPAYRTGMPGVSLKQG